MKARSHRLIQLYTAPLPLGIAAETLLASLNANAHVMSAAPMVCLAEETCISELAKLCSWDPVSCEKLWCLVFDDLVHPRMLLMDSLCLAGLLPILWPFRPL